MFFLLGAVQIVLAIVWWLADLLGRYAQWYELPRWSIAPLYAHSFLMTYALFPLFIFGFSMTAMPTWTLLKIPRGSWVISASLVATGLVLFYAGLLFGMRIMAAGVFIFLGGWMLVWATLFTLVYRNRARDRHSLGIVCMLAIGAIGVALFGIALASGDFVYAGISRRMAIWLFLLPFFMIVSHRLVPFFSSKIIQNYVLYKPRASLVLPLICCSGHFVLEWLNLYAWTWAFDLPLAAWVAYLALRWGLARSFRVKLLAMLHLSLVALALALALYGIASLLTLFGYPGVMGSAPLHAIAIGYFSATTMSLVSRVSLGHAGRALEADPLTWRCFQGLMLIALLRVLGEFNFPAPTMRVALLLITALAWLAVFIPWGLHYVPIYLRPRADGKPG